MKQYETFFSWLNLDRKGLEQVKQAVQQQDYAAAASELLTYYRTRQGIHYYDGWDKPAGPVDYDTARADAVCGRNLVGNAGSQGVKLLLVGGL